MYSSVSGSGKTVSLLELKRTLNNDNKNLNIAVAYLGFNTEMNLTDEEETHIANHPKYQGLREVLA